MRYQGVVKSDRKTKNLVKRLEAGDIALIAHKDLDEVAARSLVATGVKVVINCKPSISGRYPTPGPSVLTKNGITLIDQVGDDLFKKICEGDKVEVKDDCIYKEEELIAQGQLLNKEMIEELLENTRTNLEVELEKFVENTLTYAKKEKSIILGLEVPEVKTHFEKEHVLIVVRGQDYQADLRAIQTYIDDINPVIIGVDGGADACLELDLKPDLIIGDMDSVSDQALKSGAELVVHAYPNGEAPGMKRINELGLDAVTFPAPGTSEDIAMLLAYEKGASLLVAVGTHSNIIDFLEKGRPGMSSTFLTRMKIGSILVDARGVSKLYHKSFNRRDLTYLVAAALIPILVIWLVSPPMQQLSRLFMVWIRLTLGF